MADTPSTPKPKATGKTSTWVTPRDPKGSVPDKPKAAVKTTAPAPVAEKP